MPSRLAPGRLAHACVVKAELNAIFDYRAKKVSELLGASGAAMSEAGGSLLWFRQDLRLADNPALLAAVRHGGPVIPVFIWSPEEEGRWPAGGGIAVVAAPVPGSAGRLAAPARLPPDHPPTAQRSRRSASCWTNRARPRSTGTAATNQRSSTATASVKAALRQDGRIAESFNGSLLFEPWTVRTQQGQPYQVFSAFWKACLAQPEPAPPEDAPSHIDDSATAGRPRSN